MIFLSELVEHPLNPRFGASTRSAIPARRRAPGDPGRTLFASSGCTFPANWQEALLNQGCYSLISASGPAGLPPGLPSTPAPRPSVHAAASLTVFDANFPSSLLKTFLSIATPTPECSDFYCSKIESLLRSKGFGGLSSCP